MYIKLDMDASEYKKTQAEIFADAGKKTDAINRIFKTVGTQSDAMYAAMKKNIELSLDAIKAKYKGSYTEMVRAQEGAVAKINALNQQMAKSPLYETLGIKSIAAINAQKAAIISSYETIKKSGSATAQDLVNIEKAKNAQLKALNKEMAGDHEMSMAAMMRGVLRLYAAYYALRMAVEAVIAPFKKGFLAVDTYNQSVASLAAMVVTFTERQKGMDLAGQWEEALRYSKQMIPVLEQIAAKTLLSGQETTALANAFARQGVFLHANNQEQLEGFTRLSNALPLMTQGQEIMRQINTEVRSLMTGANAQSSMLLTTLRAIDKNVDKNLQTWRAEGTVVENIGEMLKGFGPATSLLEIQWQAVKSTLDTTVTQILRGGMLEVYEDIIEAVQEINKYLLENKEVIISGMQDTWKGIKKAIDDCAPAAKTLYDAIHAVWEVSGWLETSLLLIAGKYSLIGDYQKELDDQQREREKGWARHPINESPEDNIKRRVEAIAKALKDASDDFDLKPLMGTDAEAEKEAKRVAKVRKSAMEQMRTDIIKNNELLEGAGKTQYEKDIARINAQAAVYLDKSKDTVAVANWKASAIAVAEATESGRRNEIISKATEDYKKFMEDETSFSMDQHTNAINNILKEEKRKYDEIKKMQEEGGMSPEQASEAKELVKSNALAMMEEENNAMIADKADFYSELAGYENEYRDLVFKQIDAEAKYRKDAFKDEVAAAKWAKDQKIKFDGQVAKERFSNIADGMSSMADAFEQVSQLYDEDSKKRKQLHNISMAFNIAEKAALAAQAVYAAVVAIATQGSGDPYTAFVRIAAMTAAMGALLSSVGIAFNGGGSSSSVSKPASTVLGAEAGTASESMQNSWALLKDTYDMEYRELRGIYNEMRDLNNNISGLVASIFKSNITSSSMGFKSKSDVTGGLETMQNLLKEDLFVNILGPFGSIIANVFNRATGAILGGNVSTKIVERGVKLMEMSIDDLQKARDVLGYYYIRIKKTTSGGIFHSDSSSYTIKYAALNDNVARMFTDIYNNMGNTLVEMATSLNTDIQDVLGYTFESVKLKIKKKDTSEEVSKKINAMISDLGDKAAEALFGDLYGKYQQMDEGMYETITRLVIDKATVSELLSSTGQSFNLGAGNITEQKSRDVLTDEWIAWDKKSKRYKARNEEPDKYFTEYYEVVMTATEKTIELSESLIAMAGDLDTLKDAVSTYYDKFFSDEEKQILLQEQLTGAMEDINQALPGTRAGYRAIVEGLDLQTEAGQEAYVTMMTLAEAADQYYSTLEEVTDAATEAQNEYIESLKELIITIDEWLVNLNLSDLSPVGSEAAWRAEYTKTLTAASAQGATADTVNDFLNYATKFLTYEKSYGTDSSYQAIYDAVVSDVLAIRAMTNTTIAGYASGTNYVPKTGPYTLHEGEIVIPVKESNAIRSNGGLDAEAIGKSIAKYIGTSGAQGGDIKISIQIDGREIGNVVAKQLKTNSDLQTSVRRIAA